MLRVSALILLMLWSTSATSYPNYSNQWSHRSLFYFAPTHDQWVSQFLLESLLHRCELDQYKVEVLVITANGESLPNWLKEQFDIERLYVSYQVRKERHVMLLIDRDGQEKLRLERTMDWPLLVSIMDDLHSPPPKRHGENPCAI